MVWALKGGLELRGSLVCVEGISLCAHLVPQVLNRLVSPSFSPFLLPLVYLWPIPDFYQCLRLKTCKFAVPSFFLDSEIKTTKLFIYTFFNYGLCLGLFFNRKEKTFSRQNHSHFYRTLNAASFSDERFNLSRIRSL